MIEVFFDPQSIPLIRASKISLELVKKVVNDRHAGCVDNGFTRLIAVHWLNNENLVLVDSLITKKDVNYQNNERVCRLDEVTVKIVLTFSSSLPSGNIHKKMTAEEVLHVVSSSFGLQVSCHEEEPFAHLYSGRWDGEVRVRRGEEIIDIKQGCNSSSGGAVICVGSISPDNMTCELVWVLDLRCYENFSIEPLLMRSKLTVNNLIQIRDSFPFRFPYILPSDQALKYYIAVIILRKFLGDSWCDKHISGNAESHFRFSRSGDPSLDSLSCLWTVELAEMIFNFQDVFGFTCRLRRFAKLDFESTVAEFEAVRMLLFSGIKVNLIIDNNGQKGQDYEADIILPNGKKACCEVKTKAWGTNLSKKTFIGSLKKAARQLPSEHPGVIFLKVPETWLSKSNSLVEIIEESIEKCFLDYRRVLLVIIFWDEWFTNKKGSVLRRTMHREFTNSSSRFFDKESTSLILNYSETQFVNQWKNFQEIIQCQGRVDEKNIVE